MKPNPPHSTTSTPSRPDRTPAAQAGRRPLEQKVRALGGVLGHTRDFVAPESYVDRLRGKDAAPFTTNRIWLERHGLTFAPPKSLSPTELPLELHRLIQALAFARVFLSCTDHLNDEELYTRLFDDVLSAEEPDYPRYEDEATCWDLCEAGGDHHLLWLTYYAWEEDRSEWAEAFKEQPLPPSLPCPFDRDSTLPKPHQST